MLETIAAHLNLFYLRVTRARYDLTPPGRWCSAGEWEGSMKTRYTVALSMIAGAAVGAAAIQGLHAQAKPPVYTVSEIQITNLDAYLKEFAPIAQASIRAAGGKILAGGPGTSLEGAEPATRVTIQMWSSLEQAKAWRNGADYKKAREIGDKYAKFRAIAVEGMPQ